MPFVLSEQDRRFLQEVLNDYRDRVGNTEGRTGPPRTDPQAPEVYVAFTRSGGIPALTTVAGTGTGDEDRPGYADETPIYRVVVSEAGLHQLLPVTGLTRRVYNLSTTAVAASTWVLVFRDKFGFWFANPPGTGGGGGETATLTVRRSDGTQSVTINLPGTVEMAVPEHWSITAIDSTTLRIRAVGHTVTSLICEGDGNLHTYVWRDGWLISRDGIST